MTKLRNIGYLRFGSKIRQGFAVATPSLTPRLSCGCCLLQMQVWGTWGGLGFYIGWGSLPPPAGRQGLYAIKYKF